MGEVRFGRWAIRQVAWWMIAVVGVASLVALTAPVGSEPVRRVGMALLIGGLAVAVLMVASRWWLGLAAGGVAIVAGVLLSVDADRFAPSVVRSLAVGCAVTGFGIAVWLRRRNFGWFVVTATIGLAVGTATLFVRYDTELLPLSVGLLWLGICAVGVGGFAMAGDLVRADNRQLLARDAATSLGDWMRSRLVEPTGDTSDDIDDIVESLFYEGAQRRRQLVRFSALMAFASTIASLGVLADSTAVVIGAMLVAPLMTPLMAMSLSLVSMWPDRLARSAITAFTGALIPITIGAITAGVLGPGVDPGTNTQIVSRASPTLLDLAIALSAGAAGAYANSRRDVADSLPGVAVAIALVPPLAVVGVAAQLGDTDASRGALLLFVTNVVAIVAMGAVTFVLTGVARTPVGPTGAVGHWTVGFGAFGLVVLWALMSATSATNATGARTAIARTNIEHWADTYDYTVESVELDADDLDIVLIGEQAPDDDAVDELVDGLAHLLTDVVVTMHVDLTATVDATID